ncbi:MAG: glycosyltransferase [Dehalococcoidia bacterium]|nr:glycosyltransferase [Dehalococcoidia bacterium]MDW8119860.1 glycosyltransferase [Chloroflexota bacterium]
MDITIVIPAYNEERRIGPTLEAYLSSFTELGRSFEVLVVLNGCRDNTLGVVEEAARRWGRVRWVVFPERLGKGGAVREGLARAQGERVAFVDADNMVGPREAYRLLERLAQVDIAIASRYIPGARRLRPPPWRRRVAAWVFRQMVRVVVGLPFRDTQCGAKAFRAEAVQRLLPHLQERGWAFDVEMLALALDMGLTIAEVPVEWDFAARGSKMPTLRAALGMLWTVFRVRQRRRQWRQALAQAQQRG